LAENAFKAPCGALGRGKGKGESLFTFLGSKGHFLVKILEKTGALE